MAGDAAFFIVDPAWQNALENTTLDDDAAWDTQVLTYTGTASGNGSGIPQSSMLGEVIVGKLTEPFNVCAGAFNPSPTPPPPPAVRVNDAY